MPIWHEYMAAALWHHKVLGFELPNQYPTWHYLTHGSYGSFGLLPDHDVLDDDDGDHDDLDRADEPVARRPVAPKPPTHTTTPAPPVQHADHRCVATDHGAAATDDDLDAAALPWPSPVARSPRAR